MVTSDELNDALEQVELRDNTTDGYTLSLLRLIVEALKELIDRG